MVEWDGPQPSEDDAYVYCERCGEMNARENIHRCPFCSKVFCRSCGVRTGSKEYCSAACGRAMFMTGDEDGEWDEEGDEEGG